MPTFKHFVFHDQKNRVFFWIAITITLVEWILFKIAYPFPDFFSDSYSYIEAAAAHMDINIWPIGYSKFLYAFHTLTHSDTVLVSFQYVLLQLSALYFFFTLKYFYSSSKKTSTVLFLFLLSNPLFLYISNYITSDSIFCSLTILWITELLWIIHQPSLCRIFPQAVFVFLAYTLRYNAIYYPIVTALAFILSKQKILLKIIGTFLILLFLIPFFNFSINAGQKLTGKPIYSILSGWQLANNALYFYGQIRVDRKKLPNKDCVELDSITRRFYQTAKPGYMEFLDRHVGNYFIQDWNAPLKTYMLSRYKKPDVYAWGMVSPIFATYGSYLIKNYPEAYMRYFVLMNTKNYFIPPLEKLQIYNMGEDSVGSLVQYWFQYPKSQIHHPQSDFQEQLLFIFSPLFLLINIFFPISTAWYLLSRKHQKKSATFNKSILLVAFFWVVNFLFSITANIIALRYEFFPLILTFSFSLLLYDYLVADED